jgi:hypothetical protein
MINLLAAATLWMLAGPQGMPGPTVASMQFDTVAGSRPMAAPDHARPGLHLVSRKQLPGFLASGDNDLIVIHRKKGGAPRSNVVRICLTNRSRSGGGKGFDNHRTGHPRYVAAAGQTICGDIHPTRQALFFWKATAGGPLKPVLKQKLNLTGYGGYSLGFEWVDD